MSGLKLDNWKAWAAGAAVVIVAHVAIFGMMQVIKGAAHEHKLEAVEAAAAEKAAKAPDPVPVYILPPPAAPEG